MSAVLSDSLVEVLGALEDSIIKGFLVLRMNKESTGFNTYRFGRQLRSISDEETTSLSWMAVDSKYRRQGIGRELVFHAMKSVKRAKRNYLRVVFDPTKERSIFYSSFKSPFGIRDQEDTGCTSYEKCLVYDLSDISF